MNVTQLLRAFRKGSRASFVMALWGAFALSTAASAQNVIEDVAVAKGAKL